MYQAKSIFEDPGKLITIIGTVFVLVVLLGFLASLAGSQGAANACSVVNSTPGFVCIAGADEANIFWRDGSRPLTGTMDANGNPIEDVLYTQFRDSLGNPNAAGELQRNGANLLYYDGTDARNFLHQLTTSGQCQGYVAANNASVPLKIAVTEASNDYGALYAIGDAVDDGTVLQASVDALNNLPGDVCLSPGVYTSTSSVTLKDGQRIVGAGPGWYELGKSEGTRWDYTGNGTAFVIGSSGADRVYNAGLSNFIVTGVNAAYGTRVAGGQNVINRMLFEDFTNASGYVINEWAVSGQNEITNNWFSNNQAITVFLEGLESVGTQIAHNFFWDNDNIQIVLGATSSTVTPTSETYVGYNIFESNDSPDSVTVDACINCVFDSNLWAGQGADTSAFTAIKIGRDDYGEDLGVVTLLNNRVSCSNTWNYGVKFGTAAKFFNVRMDGNEFGRCKVAGVNNATVTPTTDSNDGWIMDLGNIATAFHRGTDVIQGTTAVFAVDSVAGGVIVPMTREDAIGDLFTASASGSDTWTIIPRKSATDSTGNAGLESALVTWRHNTTTTSLQAWTTRPEPLGNGISPVFNTTDLTNGVAADSAYFTPTSAGADVPATWLALVRVNSDNASSKTLVSKYNDQADNFEWAFDLTATETVRMSLYDDSAGGTGNVFIGRSSTATLTIGRWYLLMATYDGSATSAGIKLYSYSGTTASQIDTTDANSGSYVAIDDTDATVLIGGYTASTGSVGGVCPCNIAYTGFIPGVAMTEAEGLQAGYALMPYVGVQLGR